MKRYFNLLKRKEEENFLELAKDEAQNWAKDILKNRDIIYIDLETTGLKKENYTPGIVQISLVNYCGKNIFSSLINPEKTIPYNAEKIHGISNEMIKNSPSLLEITPVLKKLIKNKTLLAFNASFDIDVLVSNFSRYGLFQNYFKSSECVMLWYSAWCGEWSFKKKDFKWKSLPKLAAGDAHDSLVDCMSTFLLVKTMAGESEEKEVINLNF